MKFLNEIDLLQYFANEYISPRNKVLVLGCTHNFKEIKSIVEFIDSEVFFVNESFHQDSHFIVNYNNLPFEENSFDTIINFTNEITLFQFLKEGGVLLTKDEIVGGLEYYQFKNHTFTIL